MRPIAMAPALAALLLTLAPAAAVAQVDASIPIPPLADSTLERIAAEIRPPEGFEARVFAGPPHLTYPVCLHPAGDGVIFVCTDPNLLFGRERHLGRVLRFVDHDDDGVADRYSVFADSLDAVRGITFDGETLYLMHAPTLAAYRDTDGDGVADERRVLVDGLGFGLDDRNGDHTSNGLRLGIDGWIYVAVGDYGFLAATGADGTQLGLHGGGVLRVRPDGSELEVVARGTRNIYDVALDPALRLFARDNTNNGQGWNSRFHFLPPLADAGYPSLFRNFPDEAHPPLDDLGAGAATTTVWVDHHLLPPELRGRLLSADWALNRVYAHEMTPRGATFELTQREIMEVPRPVDLEEAPEGELYLASLSGGSYDYAGEHVGYVLRLRPGAPNDASPLDSNPVARLLAGGSTDRVAAQQEILRAGADDRTVRALERAIDDRALAPAARVAAVFTLKQLLGEGSHAVLVRAAEDPGIRAMVLRALTDRRGEMTGVPVRLFVRGVDDADPAVRLAAVAGLARLGGAEATAALARASRSEERTVAHVARGALVQIGGVDAALAMLEGGDAGARAAAIHVLSRTHSPRVVRALEEAASRAEGPARRQYLGALARLHHREGYWDGAWWGNQPPTEGPWFAPVRWEESPRIASVLMRELSAARGEDLDSLAAVLEREGVLPRGAGGLLRALEGLDAPGNNRVVRHLVGGRQVTDEAVEVLLDSAVAGQPGARQPLLELLAAATRLPAAAAHALAEGAADQALPAELRTRLLTALARASGDPWEEAAREAHARLDPELPGDAALLQSWRRYVNALARPEALELHSDLTVRGTPAERVLSWAVVVQTAALPRIPQETRAAAAGVVSSAWSDRERAAPLVRAIELLGVEDRYPAELARHRGS